jgi:hypothetical protein
MPDDPAYSRYMSLTDSLGGVPDVALQQAALARIAAWTGNDDIEILIYLIRHATGRTSQRCRSLLDEVAGMLAEAVEKAPAGALNFGVVVEFPVGLARRVLVAPANGGDPPTL